MSASIVILLLVIAIGLVMIEIFLIPGVGIPGLAGAILMLVSLYMAYEVSTRFGNYTLAGTALASIALVILAFRSKTWDRLSLKSGIDSRVQNQTDGLSVGMQGLAVSRLNPIGNARFNDRLMEVSSRGAFIEAESPIEIVNIEGNKITVQKIQE